MRFQLLIGMVVLSMMMIFVACDAKSKGAAQAVTPEDIIGKWIVDAASVRDMAFNYGKKQSRRMGMHLSDSEIEKKMGTIFKAMVADPPEFFFKKDGSFTIRNDKNTIDGTWTLQGDVVSVLEKGDTKAVLLKYDAGFLTSMPDSDMRKIDLVKR